MIFRDKRGRFCRCTVCQTTADFVRADMQRLRDRGGQPEHWSDELHLADVVEKHLARHLDD